MRVFLILVLLTTAGMMWGEEFRLNTPGGEISIEINGVSSNGTATSESILDQIASKLEILENQYVPEMGNQYKQQKAKRLISEIYALMALLPSDQTIHVADARRTESQTMTTTAPGTHSVTVHTTFDNQEVEPENQPMSPADFNQLVGQVSDESFADDQLSVISLAVRSNLFTVNQLNRLIELFSFSDEQIECVRVVYPKVVDKENAHQILESFTYSDDKQTVRRIIEQN